MLQFCFAQDRSIPASCVLGQPPAGNTQPRQNLDQYSGGRIGRVPRGSEPLQSQQPPSRMRGVLHGEGWGNRVDEIELVRRCKLGDHSAFA